MFRLSVLYTYAPLVVERVLVQSFTPYPGHTSDAS